MTNELLKKLSGNLLIEKSCSIRKDVVDICVKNGAGHIAPSLSTIEILVALYYNLLNISDDPLWEGRDRLIFSKAHGCYGLYSILADIGYIDREDWKNFYKNDCLSGCVERNIDKGIEASCGSLGHGLPIAVGIAFGAKLQNKNFRVYCITGDGEMQEGSNWEAIQFAVKHNLNNLTLIIDTNRLQAMDFLENVLTVKDKKDDLLLKLSAFGFETDSCNGHDIHNIIEKINIWNNNFLNLKYPQVLIANTTKGYGLFCMENIPKFHFRLPTEDELKQGNRYEKE